MLPWCLWASSRSRRGEASGSPVGPVACSTGLLFAHTLHVFPAQRNNKHRLIVHRTQSNWDDTHSTLLKIGFTERTNCIVKVYTVTVDTWSFWNGWYVHDIHIFFCVRVYMLYIYIHVHNHTYIHIQYVTWIQHMYEYIHAPLYSSGPIFTVR